MPEEGDANTLGLGPGPDQLSADVQLKRDRNSVAPDGRLPMDTDGSAKCVRLTFDAEHPDRPHLAAEGHESILDTLESSGVEATFFIQGRWATTFPDAAARIARDGHRVGNHSQYHARMPMLTLRGIRADVLGAEKVIREITGVNPRPWFRCPWGFGAGDVRVRAMLRATGYRHIGWHIGGRDWEPEREGADVRRAIVKAVLTAPNGAIVLLHTWPTSTEGGAPGHHRRPASSEVPIPTPG